MSELLVPDNFESTFTEEIKTNFEEWRIRLGELLDTLPSDIQYEFDNVPSTDDQLQPFSVGGAALSLDRIKFSFDFDLFQDTESKKILHEFKGTFFHEHYHVARGYSFKTKPDISPLELAIEEGLAVKFEMIHAGSTPRWGTYQDKETMLSRFKEISEITPDQEINWNHLKFYDPETDRHWILYRLGSFIADEVLDNNPELQIQDLVHLDYDEILEKSNLLNTT